jgi:hypothetical protein
VLEKGADGKLEIRRHDRTAEHLIFPVASIRLLITGRGRGCATSWFLLAVVVVATAWADEVAAQPGWAAAVPRSVLLALGGHTRSVHRGRHRAQ